MKKNEPRSMKSKVAFNTVFQFSEKLLIYAIGFISTSLIARHFGVLGYGKYSTANNFVTLFALFADWGVGIIVARELIKRPEGEKRIHFLANVFSFRLLISFLIYGTALLIVPFTHYANDITSGICILLVAQFIISFGQIFTSISQIYLNTLGPTLGEFFGRVASLSVIISVVVLHLNIQYTFIAILIANILYISISYVFIKKLIPLQFTIDLQVWKELTILSIPIGLAGVLGTIYFRIDSVLLSFMKSTIDVGIYSLPYKLLEILLVIPGVFMGLIMPQYSDAFHKQDTQKLTNLVNKSLEFMALLALPITAGIIVTAPKLIQLVAGKSFSTSVPLYFFNYSFQGTAALSLQILSIAILLSFLANVYGYLTIAINGQNQAFWRNVIIAAFNIIANLLIIPSLSFIGASITTVLSELLTFILVYTICQRIFPLQVYIKHLDKFIISTIIMTIAIIFLRNTSIFIIIPVATAVYALCLVITKAITRSEIHELLHIG